MMMGGGCRSEITPVMWWRVSVDDDGGWVPFRDYPSDVMEG